MCCLVLRKRHRQKIIDTRQINDRDCKLTHTWKNVGWDGLVPSSTLTSISISGVRTASFPLKTATNSLPQHSGVVSIQFQFNWHWLKIQLKSKTVWILCISAKLSLLSRLEVFWEAANWNWVSRFRKLKILIWIAQSFAELVIELLELDSLLFRFLLHIQLLSIDIIIVRVKLLANLPWQFNLLPGCVMHRKLPVAQLGPGTIAVRALIELPTRG